MPHVHLCCGEGGIILLNRRQFTGALAATIASTAAPLWALEARGVQLGLQSYTFHQLRAGGVAAAEEIAVSMQKLGVNLCELWAPQIEPFPLSDGYWRKWLPNVEKGAPIKASKEEMATQRQALRAWRTNPPQGYLQQVLNRFSSAHVRLFSFNYSFEPTMNDAEIEFGFAAAKALKVDLITASSRISDARRLVPFAAKHGMRIAFHGHAEKDDPDQISSPESFRTVLAMSPLYRINLDVAHFSSAGFDSVAFLKEQHAKITNIHVHDRKANAGVSVPFGEGVAPTKEVLQLIRDNKWPIPVFYELEYVGADGRDVIAETRRELDYEIKILNS